MKVRIAALAVLTLFSLSACVTRTVQRTAADQQTDLSGRWNDTDARLVAEEMIEDLLRRPWLERFQSNEAREPVVIVGRVRNLSEEHIDTTTFIKDIERELINSGMVRFVASADERGALRDERLDQQGQASPETLARLGEETGADFMLLGTIASNVDAIDGERSIFYQVNLELVSIENNEKVWIGEKEIKKLIEQRRARL